MGDMIHINRQPLPFPYRGWRRVELDFTTDGPRGYVLINGVMYSDPELIGWIDEDVFIRCMHAHDWECSIYSDAEGFDTLICHAVADTAAFFASRRFGEANQPDSHAHYHGEIIDHIVIKPDEDEPGCLVVEVDQYTHCYGNGNEPGWDVEQWENAKEIYEVRNGSGKQRFKEAYSLARARLRHPNVSFPVFKRWGA